MCDDHSKSKCLRTNVLQKTISVSSLALNIRRIHPASALHFIAKLTIYTWKLVSLLISMSRLNTHFDSGIAIFSRAIVYCLHVIELCVPVTQGFHACHPQPTCILCPHLVADVQNLFLSEIFVIYGKKIGWVSGGMYESATMSSSETKSVVYVTSLVVYIFVMMVPLSTPACRLSFRVLSSHSQNIQPIYESLSWWHMRLLTFWKAFTKSRYITSTLE